MPVEATERRTIPGPRGVIVGVLLVLALVVFGVMVRFLPQAVDWHYVFLPAARAMLSGDSPYTVTGYFNAPWALLPLLPLVAFPEAVGRALLAIASLAALAFVAARLGAKRITLMFLLLSPPVLHGVLNGSLDWLAALGFVMPPVVGLFFIAVKPQVGIAVAIFWFVEAARRGGAGGSQGIRPDNGCAGRVPGGLRVVAAALPTGNRPVVERQPVAILDPCWPSAHRRRDPRARNPLRHRGFAVPVSVCAAALLGDALAGHLSFAAVHRTRGPGDVDRCAAPRNLIGGWSAEHGILHCPEEVGAVQAEVLGASPSSSVGRVLPNNRPVKQTRSDLAARTLGLARRPKRPFEAASLPDGGAERASPDVDPARGRRLVAPDRSRDGAEAAHSPFCT
jgi:hypothetical protein